MVNGLRIFKEHFALYRDKYVLIGGTACTLIMEEAGVTFRATKDLDIVLCVETLNKEFVHAFKEFVRQGGYQNRQQSTGKDIFYRFSSPDNKDFPAMLELFSRLPDTIKLDMGGHLTPIPLNESSASLSAILLDDNYYHFIHAGKLEINGLPTIGASHLIPLKAKAWLELSIKRLANEAAVNEKDIKKHKNDILRLHQLLSIDDNIILPLPIKSDLSEFFLRIEKDSIDLKTLDLKNTTYEKVLNNLKAIYNIAPKCSQCGQKLPASKFLFRESGQSLCLCCANLSKLAFLPRTNRRLTRHVHKKGIPSTKVVKFVVKCYELQGILVDKKALQRLYHDILADDDDIEWELEAAPLIRK